MSLCVCVIFVMLLIELMHMYCCDYGFFFQAEDGIRDLVRSRGLGDVYKRQRKVLPVTVFSSQHRVTVSQLLKLKIF